MKTEFLHLDTSCRCGSDKMSRKITKKIGRTAVNSKHEPVKDYKTDSKRVSKEVIGTILAMADTSLKKLTF